MKDKVAFTYQLNIEPKLQKEALKELKDLFGELANIRNNGELAITITPNFDTKAFPRFEQEINQFVKNFNAAISNNLDLSGIKNSFVPVVEEVKTSLNEVSNIDISSKLREQTTGIQNAVTSFKESIKDNIASYNDLDIASLKDAMETTLKTLKDDISPYVQDALKISDGDLTEGLLQELDAAKQDIKNFVSSLSEDEKFNLEDIFQVDSFKSSIFTKVLSDASKELKASQESLSSSTAVSSIQEQTKAQQELNSTIKETANLQEQQNITGGGEQYSNLSDILSLLKNLATAASEATRALHEIGLPPELQGDGNFPALETLGYKLEDVADALERITQNSTLVTQGLNGIDRLNNIEGKDVHINIIITPEDIEKRLSGLIDELGKLPNQIYSDVSVRLGLNENTKTKMLSVINTTLSSITPTAQVPIDFKPESGASLAEKINKVVDTASNETKKYPIKFKTDLADISTAIKKSIGTSTKSDSASVPISIKPNPEDLKTLQTIVQNIQNELNKIQVRFTPNAQDLKLIKTITDNINAVGEDVQIKFSPNATDLKQLDTITKNIKGVDENIPIRFIPNADDLRLVDKIVKNMQAVQIDMPVSYHMDYKNLQSIKNAVSRIRNSLENLGGKGPIEFKGLSGLDTKLEGVANNLQNALAHIGEGWDENINSLKNKLDPLREILVALADSVKTIKNAQLNIKVNEMSGAKGGKYDNGLGSLEKEITKFQGSSQWADALSGNMGNGVKAATDALSAFFTKVYQTNSLTAEEVGKTNQEFAQLKQNLTDETNAWVAQQKAVEEAQKAKEAQAKAAADAAQKEAKAVQSLKEKYDAVKNTVEYRNKNRDIMGRFSGKEIYSDTDNPVVAQYLDTRDQYDKLGQHIEKLKSTGKAYDNLVEKQKELEKALKKSWDAVVKDADGKLTQLEKAINAYSDKYRSLLPKDANNKVINNGQYNEDAFIANPNSKNPDADYAAAYAARERANAAVEGYKQRMSKGPMSNMEIKNAVQDIKNLTDVADQLEKKLVQVSQEGSEFLGVFRFAEGSRSLEGYKDVLNQAYNANINWTKSEEIAGQNAIKVTGNYRTQDNQLRTLVVSIDKTNGAMRQLSSTTSTYTSFMDRFKNIFSNQMMSFWGFLGTRFSAQALVTQLRQGLTVVRDFDSAMTELRKVSNDTEQAINSFGKEAHNIAAIVGSTGTAVVNAAADWSRLGYSIAEASELAKSSAIFVNVGDEGMDIGAATEDIVSIMKAFNYTADESIDIVDKLNIVGNNFAISSTGLGSALQRSSASLAAANNTLEESIALITAGNEIVQAPENVGTALKIMSLRIRGATTDLAALGEETDGVIATTAKLQNKLQKLTGVNILEADNVTFKSTYQILEEISKVWDTLTDVEQADVLETLAGKARSNVMAAIISNFEKAQESFAMASEATGSAMQENERYLDSIQGKMNILANTWQGMWVNAIPSEVAKDVLDITNNLSKMLSSLGGIWQILGQIGGQLALIKGKSLFSSFMANRSLSRGGMDAIIQQITGVASSQGMGAAANVLKEMSEGADVAQRTFANACKSLLTFDTATQQWTIDAEEATLAQTLQNTATANGVGDQRTFANALKSTGKALRGLAANLAVSAIVMGIGLAISKIREYQQALKDANNEAKNNAFAQTTNYQNNVYDEKAIQQLKEYQKQTKLSNEESENAESIIDSLAEKYGKEGKAIADSNESIKDRIDALVDLDNQQRNALKSSQNLALSFSQRDFADNLKTLGGFGDNKGTLNFNYQSNDILNRALNGQGYIDAYNKMVDNILKGAGNIVDKSMDEFGNITGYLFSVDPKDIEKTIKQYDYMSTALLEVQEEIDAVKEARSKETDAANIRYYDDQIKALEKWQEQLNYTKVTLEQAGFTDVLTAMGNIADPDGSLASLQEYLDARNNLITNANTKLNQETADIVLSNIFGEENTAYYNQLLERLERRVEIIQNSTEGEGIPLEIALQLNTDDMETFLSDDFLKWVDSQVDASGKHIAINIKNYDTLIRMIRTYRNEGVQTFTSLTSQIVKNKDTIDAYQEKLSSLTGIMTNAFSGAYGATGGATAFLNDLRALSEQIEALDDGANAVNLDGIFYDVEHLGDIAEDVARIQFEELMDKMESLPEVAKNAFRESFEESLGETKLQAQIDSLNNLGSAYNDLTSIVESYNEVGSFTLESLTSLINMSPDYLACLEWEGDQLTINEEMVRTLAMARLDEAAAQVQQNAQAQIAAVIDGELATQEAQAATNAANAATQIATFGINAQTAAGQIMNATLAISDLNAAMGGAGISSDALAQIEGIRDNANQQIAALNNAKDALASGGMSNKTFFGGGGGGGGGGGKDAAKEAKDLIDDVLTKLEDAVERGEITYIDYINAMKEITDDYYRRGKISFDEYMEYQKKYYQSMVELYKKVASAAMSYLDDIADEYQDQIDDLNDQKDAIEEYYDVRIDKLNEEKKALEKQKKEIEKYYEAQIEPLEKEKEALERANEERENAMQLQQAQYNLNRALNQRTKQVYSGGQFTYQVDDAAVRDARNELESANYDNEVKKIEDAITALEDAEEAAIKVIDEQIDKIDEQIDKYEEAKEKATKAIDKQIDGIQKMIDVIQDYKDEWQKVIDQWQKAQDQRLLEQFFGGNWKEGLESLDLGMLTQFSDGYLNACGMLAAGNNDIKKSLQELGNYDVDSLLGQYDAITDAHGNLVTVLSQEIPNSFGTNVVNDLDGFREKYQLGVDQIYGINSQIPVRLDEAREAIRRGAQGLAGAIDIPEIATNVNNILQTIGELSGIDINVDSFSGHVTEVDTGLSNLVSSVSGASTSINSSSSNLANDVNNIGSSVTDLKNTLGGEGGTLATTGGINSEQFSTDKDALNASLGEVTTNVQAFGDDWNAVWQGAATSVATAWGTGGGEGGEGGGTGTGGEGGMGIISTIQTGSATLMSLLGEDGGVVGQLIEWEPLWNEVWTQIANDVVTACSRIRAQIDSTIQKIDALKSAMNGMPSGNFTITPTGPQLVNGQVKGTYDIQGTAKGGVITAAKGTLIPADNGLNGIANALGEDVMVAAKKGERVLTVQQNKNFEELVRLTPDLISASTEFVKYARLFDNLDSSTNNVADNIASALKDVVSTASVRNVTNNNVVTLSIGDIHVDGVQDVSGFATAIKNNLPNSMLQVLTGRV